MEQWLHGVAEAASAGLSEEMGLTAATFSWVGHDLRFSAKVLMGEVPPKVREMFLEGPIHLTPEERALAYGPKPSPLSLMSELVERHIPGRSFDTANNFEHLRMAGVRDFRGAQALDPSGCGYALAAPLRARAGVPPHELARWSRLRAHLLAGLRLHTAAQSPVEAIIEPGGALVHAEPGAASRTARHLLRDAALRVDRARSRRGRMDPDAALVAWEALVSGRWSLVDRFDSDGRRYYVARRNDPELARPRPLSRRERQVLAYATLGRSNKEIAYELGLAASTVSTHLANAMRQLGIKSRAALAEMWSLGAAATSQEAT